MKNIEISNICNMLYYVVIVDVDAFNWEKQVSNWISFAIFNDKKFSIQLLVNLL